MLTAGEPYKKIRKTRETVGKNLKTFMPVLGISGSSIARFATPRTRLIFLSTHLSAQPVAQTSAGYLHGQKCTLPLAKNLKKGNIYRDAQCTISKQKSEANNVFLASLGALRHVCVLLHS